MAKKTLGYAKLIWTCPNCNTRNPGPVKTCQSCGSPQPKDVEFEQASQEDLLKDAEEIRKARAGADIHCPYCGTRNPAGSVTCSQCHGDLREGKKRTSGRVVGAFRNKAAEKIKCPACGAWNDPDAAKCAECGSRLGRVSEKKTQAAGGKALSNSAKIVMAVVGLAIAGGLCFLVSRVFKRDTLGGTVKDVNWQRSMQVEQYQIVELEDWWDEIPQSAEVIYCEEAYRYTSSDPVDNSVEVCGTPYTIDQGSGYAEVVQDCEYQVYEEYCSYQTEAWIAVDTITSSGSSLQASWPNISAGSNQRTGSRSEEYVILFETNDGIKRFVTSDYTLFQRCTIGSRWELSEDGFGNILNISQ